MGLIEAAKGSVGGVLADQWREYFYCEAIEPDILVTKGQHRTSGRSSNYKGSDNIITNGSVIAVADGQCMLIVDQGRVTELCAEPGEFIYDSSTEPTLFYGKLSQTIPEVFRTVGRRFTFGGEPPKDQRIYFVNTKELTGNKYGTPSPVPFRVVDRNIGLDVDIDIRCFGEYSYRITNPILFYTNVCGNVSDRYERSQIEGQMKTELLSALQPAFARISDMGIRYSALPGHTMEMADAMNQVLSQKWAGLRGMEIVSFGVSSVKASEQDEQMIKDLQKSASLGNARVAAGHLVGAQAAAMQAAAQNESTGPAMAFMGMNMAAGVGGMNTGDLFRQAQQEEMTRQQMPQTAPKEPAAPGGWTCACGQTDNTGKFCHSCGSPKPVPADSWICACGHVSTGRFCTECGAKRPEPAQENSWACPSCGTRNQGKFCSECGTRKPAGVPQYRCDKCGWEPADPAHPPKFCPECGDPFDQGDLR